MGGAVGGVARGQGTGQRQEETGECSIPEGSERGGSHTPLGQGPRNEMRTKKLTPGFSNMGVTADFDKGVSGGQDDEGQWDWFQKKIGGGNVNSPESPP